MSSRTPGRRDPSRAGVCADMLRGVLQDDRDRFERVLRPARESAYAPGEYAEQESFMLASEILDLARRAGVAPGVAVLDLCCGVAGPGRLVTRSLGCAYVGVDASERALAIACDRAAGLDCRFVVAEVPPVPPERCEVVILLETMLAFADKAQLIEGVARALPTGGRFAFTLEEGAPLSPSERALMPDADTVWLSPWAEVDAPLTRFGLRTVWHRDHSASHRAVADALIEAFTRERDVIASQLGARAIDELIAGHRLWSEWLATGRVRKLAVVAEKAG
jgi:sarcosine/dimethylglycine N-methyltransferase